MKLCSCFSRGADNADRDKARVSNPWSEQQERFAWLGASLLVYQHFPHPRHGQGDNWEHLTLHTVMASSISARMLTLLHFD